MDDEFRTKLRLARADLRRLGFRNDLIAPIPWRIAWKLGLAWAPPLLANRRVNVRATFLIFAAPVCGLTLIGCASKPIALATAITVGESVVVCWALAALIASLYHSLGRNAGLPHWDDLRLVAGVDQTEPRIQATNGEFSDARRNGKPIV